MAEGLEGTELGECVFKVRGHNVGCACSALIGIVDHEGGGLHIEKPAGEPAGLWKWGWARQSPETAGIFCAYRARGDQ